MPNGILLAAVVAVILHRYFNGIADADRARALAASTAEGSDHV